MKKIIYSVLIIFVLFSCNSNKSDKKEQKSSQLTFGIEKYEEKTKLSNLPETKLTASIPIAKGDSRAAKNINDRIFEITKLIITQESDNSTNYDELFTGFIKNYEQFVIDYPDYPIGWEVIINGSVEYDSPEIVDIKIESYAMMGGAHGNSFTTSLIFNPENGKELTINDIINDTNSLSNLAEKKFREKYNISTDKSINSTGFMFENDKFILPQNYFITKDGLLLFYNTYEIAAYVEGSKEILIPYNELKDNLKIKIS